MARTLILLGLVEGALFIEPERPYESNLRASGEPGQVPVCDGGRSPIRLCRTEPPRSHRGGVAVELAFADFVPYRIEVPLDARRLRRTGVVLIGGAFIADLAGAVCASSADREKGSPE